MMQPKHLLKGILLLLALLFVFPGPVLGGPRQQSANVDYVWWLVGWIDNRVICTVVTDDHQPPDGHEIFAWCGPEVQAEWMNTPTCQRRDETSCEGIYLFFAGTTPAHPEPPALEIGSREPNLVSCTWDYSEAERNSLWHSSETFPEDLVTYEPYAWLAGHLINVGQVDSSACADGGLLSNGAASPCGLAESQNKLHYWQNRWNLAIFEAAWATDIPAMMLKLLLAQESQFWPIALSGRNDLEVGLGQVTGMGADSTLRWNQEAFAATCYQVFNNSVCEQGYSSMHPEEQALLRGMWLGRMDASCPSCELGIDFEKAMDSILPVAQTIQAYCGQTAYVLLDLTDQPPRAITSYEDMLRFSLASYNVGSGCLASAFQATLDNEEALSWEYVSSNFSEGCQSGINYVERISNLGGK